MLDNTRQWKKQMLLYIFSGDIFIRLAKILLGFFHDMGKPENILANPTDRN